MLSICTNIRSRPCPVIILLTNSSHRSPISSDSSSCSVLIMVGNELSMTVFLLLRKRSVLNLSIAKLLKGAEAVKFLKILNLIRLKSSHTWAYSKSV